MKKSVIIILSVLFIILFFVFRQMWAFSPQNVHVTMRPIPPNSEATEKRFDGSYQFFTRRFQDKDCDCPADNCGGKTHKCLEWVKTYTTGQLASYTVYKAKPLPNNKFLEELVYLIEFDTKNKISTLGDETGVQYFDEDGKLVKVCDKFDDGPTGFRTCWEINTLGIWTSSTESWVE